MIRPDHRVVVRCPLQTQTRTLGARRRSMSRRHRTGMAVLICRLFLNLHMGAGMGMGMGAGMGMGMGAGIGMGMGAGIRMGIETWLGARRCQTRTRCQRT
ncbi:hypothetical protein DFP73DRAFT_548733 [Morchella snyderi]|nr:hypothetical protein DFP73DRAFT_548733 [Morchella snyderi]